MTPEFIVIHTAAFSGKNCDRDTIDRWHKNKGWNGIGYHYVIINDRHELKPDGLVEKGRPDHVTGAHAYGINGRSLGICCIGHGDKEAFTEAQMVSLQKLVTQLMGEHRIPLNKVIGHRELNTLIANGELEAQYKTSKSCPGKKIDMDELRQGFAHNSEVEEENNEDDTLTTNDESKDELNDAIDILKKHMHLYPNAQDELAEFLFHPEVIALTR